MNSCSGDEEEYINMSDENEDTTENLSVLSNIFGNNMDLDNLHNYTNQVIPNYTTKDNTGGNTVTDAKATLGGVLF